MVKEGFAHHLLGCFCTLQSSKALSSLCFGDSDEPQVQTEMLLSLSITLQKAGINFPPELPHDETPAQRLAVGPAAAMNHPH